MRRRAHPACRLARIALAGAIAAALAPTMRSAHAQAPQLPGLVVTVPTAPPPQAAPAQPTAVQPAVPPPALKPTVKPKPKPAPTREANAAPGTGTGKGGQAIIVLVNDDPVTAFEVEQRQRLMALQSNIGERAQENMKRLAQSEATQQRFRAQAEEIIRANQGKPREQIMALIEQSKAQFAQSLQRQAVESARASVLPGLKKAALEELIEERLKLQEAKRLNISPDEAQVDGVIKTLAERNKMTPQQFAQHLGTMGADVNTMKSRYRAQFAWAELIRRKFAAQISINLRDVEKLASSATDIEDQVDLQVARITLQVAGKLDQRVMAQRFQEADQLRARFSGCKSMAGLAGKAENARYEDLGMRKPASISEPTRTLLLNAKDGEMVPPTMGAGGLELYAVCSRKVFKADEQKRAQAQQELQQKEFEILAKRHLRDIRHDAHIEYR